MADGLTYLLLGISIALNAVCIWLMHNQTNDRIEAERLMDEASALIEANNIKMLDYIRQASLDVGIVATKRHGL